MQRVKVGLQTKLIFLLLVVSIVSMLVIALVSYRSGRQALEQNVYDRLTGIREARKAQLTSRLGFVRGQVATLSEDKMVLDAIKEFKAAFQKLPATIQADSKKESKADALRAFYEKDFLPRLRQNHDANPQLDTYLPRSPIAAYLQYYYLAANPNPYLEKGKLDTAVEPSDYSRVHAFYHPRFRKIAQSFGYDDLMLIDLETAAVLYSVDKTTEFGLELTTGPYSSTNLAELVRTLQKNKDPSLIKGAPFEAYAPNLNRPASFVATPVAEGANLVGLLVFQFPIDSINRIVAGDYAYERDGLGKTGEVVLIAHDHTMRSVSRFFHEDPDAYLTTLTAAGYPKAQTDRIRNSGTTILAQEIRSPIVDKALAGETETAIVKDYRGKEVLCSCSPVEMGLNRWMIMVKMDAEEAFAPIRAFERDVAISAVVVTLILGLVALTLSWFMVRPLHKLLDGARKVAAGQTEVTVRVDAQDEMRELADAFNGMTARLAEQAAQIAAREQEHEALLFNILPGPAAERLMRGQQQISDSHADVTVLFAKLVGFTELTESLPADKAIALLNDLIVAFDDAADRFGVEKIKTNGSAYMAACGLSVQRPDHAHRMVEFALELLRIVRVFGQERGGNLGLQVGIHCGPVVGGIVGRTRFVYDLWGETINLAHTLQQTGATDAIRVTQAIHDRLRDLNIFEGPVKIDGPRKGKLAVWTVVPPVATPTVAVDTPATESAA
jgi:class 3 adenylate cyclase